MRGVLVACAFMACGCASATPNEVVSGRLCEAPVVMSSGVAVKAVFDKEGGGCTLTCTYNRKETPFFTPRDCGIYADPALQGRVVLWDRNASNEDRLVFLDLTRDEPAVYYLEHEDGAGGYIHSHYRAMRLAEGVLTAEEYQYSGDAPDRHRRVSMSLNERPPAPSFSEWEADKD